jgi:hypothetical protein
VAANSIYGSNQALNAMFKPSYAQVLSTNPSGNFQNYWLQRHARHSSPAQLAGFVSSFKFPSFPPIIWPDKSFLTWFKAHGPALEIKTDASFSELLLPFSSKKITENPVSLHSSPPPLTPLPPCNSAPASSSVPPLVDSPLPMANILIDPRPFVPHGFQIQHIEGRNSVKRVVVARRPSIPCPKV